MDNWIDATLQLPKEVGWYKVKTKWFEFEAPFVNNAAGKMVWVIPGTMVITHWKNK